MTSPEQWKNFTIVVKWFKSGRTRTVAYNVTLEAHRAREAGERLLRRLRNTADDRTNITILGCYPTDVSEGVCRVMPMSDPWLPHEINPRHKHEPLKPYEGEHGSHEPEVIERRGQRLYKRTTR